MASIFIKKDGSKIPFNSEKIKQSIAAAAQETELSEERKKEVVDQVTSMVLQMAGEREEIGALEVKDKILQELDDIEPSVSKSWRDYDLEKNK